MCGKIVKQFFGELLIQKHHRLKSSVVTLLLFCRKETQTKQKFNTRTTGCNTAVQLEWHHCVASLRSCATLRNRIRTIQLKMESAITPRVYNFTPTYVQFLHFPISTPPTWISDALGMSAEPQFGTPLLGTLCGIMVLRMCPELLGTYWYFRLLQFETGSHNTVSVCWETGVQCTLNKQLTMSTITVDWVAQLKRHHFTFERYWTASF